MTTLRARVIFCYLLVFYAYYIPYVPNFFLYDGIGDGVISDKLMTPKNIKRS